MKNSDNQVYTEKLMEQISDRMNSVADTSHDCDDQLKKKAGSIPLLVAALEKFVKAQNKELFSQISRSFHVKRFPDIITLLQFPVRLIGGILRSAPRLVAIIVIVLVLLLLFWLISFTVSSSQSVASAFASSYGVTKSGGWIIFAGFIGGFIACIIIPLIARIQYIRELKSLCEDILEETRGLKHIALVQAYPDGRVLAITADSDAKHPVFGYTLTDEIKEIIRTKCNQGPALVWDYKDGEGHNVYAIASVAKDNISLVWTDSVIADIKDDFYTSVLNTQSEYCEALFGGTEILEIVHKYFKLKDEYFQLKNRLMVLQSNAPIWDSIAVNKKTRDELIARLGMFIAGDKAANRAVFLQGPVGSGREFICSALAASMGFSFASLEDHVFSDIDTLNSAWEIIRKEKNSIIYIENAESIFNVSEERDKKFSSLFDAWLTLLKIDQEQERKIWIVFGCQDSSKIVSELHRIMNAATVEIHALDEEECKLLLTQTAAEINFTYEIPDKIAAAMTGATISECIKLLNIMKQKTVMGGNVDYHLWKKSIAEVRKGHVYTYKEAMEAIESMVGLKIVKKKIQTLVNQAKLVNSEKFKGKKLNEFSHHMVFVGNPGTGKTTVARYIAAIYHHLGIIKKPVCVECSKKDFESSYQGETAAKTQRKIEEALDGVLFIDEAYTLVGPDPQNPDKLGKEAIDVLLKMMEDHRDRLVVIVAGYTNEMRHFIDANPGLKSRFTDEVLFEDYNAEELYTIFRNMAEKDSLKMDENASKRAEAYFKMLYSGRDDNFGNAREVRKFFESVTSAQQNRLVADEQMDDADFSLLTVSDIENAAGGGFAGEKALEAAMAELNALSGLATLKKQIAKMVAVAKFRQQQLEAGQVPAQMSWHMEFLGNPGTGKTTVARIMGKIFKALGLLKTDKVIEVTKQNLVAGYVGQTAIQTTEVIKSALDGILFVDEAYMLADGGWGKEAIETLMKGMEDHRNNLVVITAGYEEEMKQFRESNPGIPSRFKHQILFEDYSSEDLLGMFKTNIAEHNLSICSEAEKYIINYFNKLRKTDHFGNAREARKIAEEAISVYAEFAASNEGRTDNVIDEKLAQYLTGVADNESMAKDFNAAMEELNKLEGVDAVREIITELSSTAEYLQERRTAGAEVEAPSIHMVFTGPPGTGKTTVARIMGRVLKGLGLLSRGHVVEADREKMIGAGGANVKELVKKALDGVLFIDEAYTLSGSDPSHPDPMGKEAIDTLLKEMEDKRDRMVVIAAGYTNEMRRFLETNPGLQSRFTKTVEFRNYSSALLVKICKSGLQKDGLNLAPEAEDMLARYFDRLKRTGKENFGNAREARNQAEKIIALYSQERKSGREDFVPGVVDKAVIRKLTGEATNSEDELNAALAELKNLIGLDSVKKNIAELVDYARYVKQQRERGVEPKAQSLHMVFTGAPGTGKTTVARLMGRIYKAMGFLPTDKLVETGRSDLVGRYMGETAIKTRDVIKSALGGILFIDEAYTLNQGERDEFGHEAIDTLLKEMEDNRDNLLVIAAGYTNDMRHFLESNPGLQSRFTTTVNFENYTPEQLMQVFTLNARSENLTVTSEAEDSILKYFKRIANPKNENFGNAREARGLLEKILRVHAGNYKEPDFQPDVISLKDVQAFTGGKSAEELEKDLEKAIASLNNLIGLREVKSTVQKFVSLAKYNLEQEKAGVSVKGQSYHMVFSGAPGTGKTTVARMMGKIFKALGILKTDKVIEIDRSGLVGQHVGETAVKTKDVIKSAMDGILFIDEAYTLAGADPAHTDSFGLEAINTLLKEMEDNRERLVVIVAGYTNEMRRFIESNTGLQSRFQTTVHFENYTAEELIEVLKLNAKSEGKVFSGEALEAAFKYFKRIANPKNEKFGNAREARKLYELVTQEHALRMGQPGFDITRIELCDIQSFTGEQSAEESAKAYEKAIAELNALTGLASVKETVTSISQTAKFARMQLDNGVEIAPPALHMVFTGAPGTGKTTVARLMGKIFKAIGVLATDKVVEVSRGDLVGQYMGHTAIKTKDVIKSAMDGILFVDEAYTLNQGERDEFGHEAIDTLLKEMEDHRDRLVVIIAGYTRDIENFISSNSGLESRFTQYVEFENYTPDELMEIIMGMARKSKLTLDERANGDLYGYFMRIANPANPKFGNAREARKIFEKILAYHSMNIGKEGFDMSLLTESEIRQAIEYLQK